MTLRIDDFTISAEDWPDEFGHSYVWRTTDVPTPKDHHAGHDESGRILVCLDIDGTIDIVYGDLGQSGDLGLIGRTITALEQVRDGLTTAYGGRSWPGRCFSPSDWGRCRASLGHEGDHEFPTEAQYRSMQVVRTAS